MPPNEQTGSIAVQAQVYRYDCGPAEVSVSRDIAVETAVEVSFGGAPFAVMMMTPGDLEDFALGFAFTEGIVRSVDEVRGIEIEWGEESARIDVALSGERMAAHLARKRAMSGRTGCGLCGLEDLAQLPKLTPRASPAPRIAPLAVRAAVSSLEVKQPLNARTRAVHAAAWCRLDGAIVEVREDVGRHNALDKLIGALLRARADPDCGFIVITSRCSFEMVAKAAAFGTGTLVAVSAPTSLALRRAAEAGLDLIAVARSDHALIFSGETPRSRRGAAA